jgi:phage shock protein A
MRVVASRDAQVASALDLRGKMMKAEIDRYLDAEVAARRTERQINQQEAAWNRWVARARLAHTLGDEQLADAARRRALLHGEAVAWLRSVRSEQDALVRQLAAQIKAERRR